jgi:hypothetical protein
LPFLHTAHTTIHALRLKAQFEGIIRSDMDSVNWEIWAPPKCNIFSWLIIQNRVWTCDRLARCGWPNGGTCPLCGHHNETTSHLLFNCRYSICIWILIKDSLGLVDLDPPSWNACDDVEAWWTTIILAHEGRRKALVSLLMLAT